MAARRRTAGRRTARQARRRSSSPSSVTTIVLSAMIGLFLLSIAWQFRPEPEADMVFPASPLKVLVLNGCGKTGLAAVFSEKLRRVARGAVDVVNTENAPVMDHRRTVVMGHGDGERWAGYVGSLIGCDTTAATPPSRPHVDVTVVLGYDFERLFPDKPRWWETP